MKKATLVALAIMLVAVPGRAVAADKTHQQLMAEIRMLQEQQQQLQQMLGTLADTLKTISTKLEDQTAVNRKAFADQKLSVDNIGEGMRILREKADDTNVRLSTMTQAIEDMRQSIAAMPAPNAAPAGEPAAVGTTPPTQPAAPPQPPPGTANVSSAKMYDNAFADYTAGQWELAAEGFQSYIRMFPRSDKADDAQLNIGNSLYGAGKNREAVGAYQKVISDYPNSDSVPVAYFKLGLAYEALRQTELAKKAYETVIEKYPTAYEAILAKQRLDNLNRRD